MNNTSVQYKHDKLVLTPRMRWKRAGEFPQDRLIKTLLNPSVNNMHTIASSVWLSWKAFVEHSLEWSWINLTFFQSNDVSFNCFCRCSVRSDTTFEILKRCKLLNTLGVFVATRLSVDLNTFITFMNKINKSMFVARFNANEKFQFLETIPNFKSWTLIKADNSLCVERSHTVLRCCGCFCFDLYGFKNIYFNFYLLVLSKCVLL